MNPGSPEPHKLDQESSLVFYKLGSLGGLGDIGPYAHKLHAYLKMAGIEFRIETPLHPDLYADSPTNLCPYVIDGEEVIADSNVIIEHLNKKFDDPLNDKRLNRRQLATGKLLKSLCEDEFFKVIIYGRWKDGDYKTYHDSVYPGCPEEASEHMLEFVQGLLHDHRVRFDDHELYRGYLRECLDAIDEFLGDGPYLFGESPSSYDASVFGLLSSLVHFPVPNPQVKIARSYPKIVDYCDRLRTEYFSDEAWGRVKE